MMRDRGYVRELLQRARQVGVETLVFTVDLAVVGSRHRDTRNGMGGGLSTWGSLRSALNFAAHPRWLADVALGGRPLVFGNLASYVASAKNIQQFRSWIDSQFDPSVTWKDIDWLRREWPGTLIIKGILEPEDALAAVESGAQGIVVSNHGGRQLDSAPSSISALPRIADAVGNRLEIMMDGGVHSGQDVVKALALGASSVMIGRAWVYALAARGEAGVRHILAQLQREVTVTMALTGTTRVEDVDSGILHPDAVVARPRGWIRTHMSVSVCNSRFRDLAVCCLNDDDCCALYRLPAPGTENPLFANATTSHRVHRASCRGLCPARWRRNILGKRRWI
jgi:L-lactate dehydrogenase (cytochrome)